MSSAQLATAPVTLKQTVTLAANTPIQKGTLYTLIADPYSTTTRDEFQIPDGESWEVSDLYISVAGDVPAGGDVYVQLEKNRRRTMGYWGPLSTMLISNQQRPQLKYSVLYRAGEILRMYGVNIAAIGGSPIVDNTYMEVHRTYVVR